MKDNFSSIPDKQVVKELQTIKNYYNPIQPTVKVENGSITYQELRPHTAIENFIYCFWQLKTKQKLDRPYTYRVVSDGCIDIFFDHHKPVQNFIMGFCKKYTEFSIGKEFDYIGIRFLPAAFPLLFSVNAKLLSNNSQQLEQVLPDLSNWITSKIKPTEPFETVALQLEQQLIDITRKKNFQYDQRFFNALNLIFQKKGLLTTEKELNTGLSPRQLRRVFNFYIGTTSKRFSNVVRFQCILNAKPSKQSLKKSKLYFDLGFYDQAHFIKNFKTFYGITPSEAFR